MYSNREQYVDIKRIWKMTLKRAWILCLAVILGVLLGASIYKVYTGITNGEPKYQATKEYYFTFDFDKFVHAADFFNAYTWNTILKSDIVVDDVMSIIPDEISRDEVISSVSAEMLSDYRLLTVHVTTNDARITKIIADAYMEAIPKFAIDNDMIFSAKVWTDNEVIELKQNTRTANAALLGGVIGFIVALVILFMIAIMDDHIYSERDWVERYPEIPYLGLKDTDEFRVNADHIIGNIDDISIIKINELRFEDSFFESLRAKQGVVIALCDSSDSGEMIDKMIYTLKKQDIAIKGVMVMN